MIRGITKNIAMGGPADKDSDPSEVLLPTMIDKRNGVTTDQGGWRRRPGYAETWDLGESSPVDMLIPEYGGFAVTRSKQVYHLDATPTLLSSTIRLTGAHRPYHVWYRHIPSARPMAVLVDGGRPLKITTQPTGLDYLGGNPIAARFAGVIDTRLVLAGHNDLDFVWSDLENPESFPEENFNTVTGDGEALVNFKILERILYFFKTGSIEAWVNLGEDFGRRSISKPGMGAPDSLVEAARTMFWYADDGDFYVLNGGAPKVVSGMYSRTLREAGDLSDMYGFDFAAERVIRWYAPKANRCFVFDYAHQIFSEDNAWNGDWIRMPVSAYMEQSPDQCFIGDYEATGKIYRWSRDYRDDNGRLIRVYRKFTIPLSDNGGMGRANRLRLRLKRGTSEEGSSKALVTWAMDRTNRGSEDISLGASGETNPYVDVWNLGIGQELDLEIVESQSVDSIVHQAFLTSEQLGT